MGEWQHPAHYTEQAKEYSKRLRAAEVALFKELALPSLREAARIHEYAITLHGSEIRDLDLVLIPWSDDASEPDVVINAIAEATARATGWGHLTNKGKREQKPHGRFAIMILASSELHLDISVMPLQKKDS